MNNFKKLASILLALVMVFTMTTFAFAAEQTATAGEGPATITITNVDDGYEYVVYKVFDAVPNADGSNASFTLVAGKTTAPAGFTVDDAGNVTYTGENAELTADDIAAIAAYVAGDTAVITVVANEGTDSIVISGLDYGYYYITTTTGTLVMVDNVTKDVSVEDKNTAPTATKTITDTDASTDDDTNDLGSIDATGENAIAQVGKAVEFTATITVGKGAEGYVFHDWMDTGLDFDDTSVKVTVTPAATGVAADVDAANYTLNTTPDDEHTFDIEFEQSFIDTLKAGDVITITYEAVVTNEALTIDNATNTANVEYGDPNSTSTSTTVDKTTEVYTAQVSVNKFETVDGDKQPLEGAGFVVMNADGDYYKLADGVVSWVDSINDATEYKSAADGTVAPFTGLANGTYTLVEKTVPSGYNKAADKEFTINAITIENADTVANLAQEFEVENKKGSLLPSTGGIGTTIFYISGAVLAIAAVVFLVTKKRMSGAEEE